MIFHWGRCDHGILCGEEVWGSAKKGSGNKINCLQDCQQDSLESCPVGCQKELVGEWIALSSCILLAVTLQKQEKMSTLEPERDTSSSYSVPSVPTPVKFSIMPVGKGDNENQPQVF